MLLDQGYTTYCDNCYEPLNDEVGKSHNCTANGLVRSTGTVRELRTELPQGWNKEALIKFAQRLMADVVFRHSFGRQSKEECLNSLFAYAKSDAPDIVSLITSLDPMAQIECLKDHIESRTRIALR
jgi:hypothetical protein